MNKAITITNETPTAIFFDYKDKELDYKNCKIEKKGGWNCGDTRYIQIGEVMYDDIGFDVTDGHAVSNGIYHTNKWSDKRGFCMGEEINIDENINDVVEFNFPTIREILSSKKLLNESLYYMDDLGVPFYELLESAQEGNLDLTWFFEGFFFGGTTSKKYKTFINGKLIKD